MSYNVTFEFDMKAFNEALDELPGVKRVDAMLRTVHAIAYRIEALAKTNAESTFMHKPPKDLIQTIQTQQPVATGDNRVECDVLVGSVMGAIREYGGTIQATRGPNLTFRTEDGQWHSVPAVLHPAQPYLRPAVDSEDDLQMVGETVLADEIARAGGA
jgi:hypothetical protein